MDNQHLVAAAELAAKNGVRFPNESEEYRSARDALLAEEIELRRHIERVAEQRRALPPGGEVTKDYRFEGEDGPGDLRRPVRRQADAGRLQLHVRPAARAAVPDVHLAAVGLGRRGARHPAARCVGRRRALADRAAASPSSRSAAGTTCRSIPTSTASSAATITRSTKDGGDDAAFNVFTRRDGTHPPFLERRDGLRNGRSRPGSARRARPDAALDHPRLDAGRARRTGIRSCPIEKVAYVRRQPVERFLEASTHSMLVTAASGSGGGSMS